MPVVYSTATKTARLQAVVAQIGANGKFKLRSASDVLLASFTLAATAGTVSGDLLTFSDANGATDGIFNTTALADGVATKAEITTSADVTVISGLTVGKSGTDVIIVNDNLAVGQEVRVTSAAIQHAA